MRHQLDSFEIELRGDEVDVPESPYSGPVRIAACVSSALVVLALGWVVL